MLYNPSIPNSKRTTIQKLSSYLKGIFDLALDDLYIVSNPAYNIMSKFPSKKQHNRANNVNNDIKGLEKIEDIKEFIYDLKCDTEMQISTKHALYLQILSANRPTNTTSAKWKYINLEAKTWTIPSLDMKNQREHIVYLNDYMIEILNRQKALSNGIYVFPSARDKNKPMARDTLSKAIRTLANGKWEGKLSPHGFRKTFRTHASWNLAQLIKHGITEKTIEETLAHSSKGIAGVYELSKATEEQRLKLSQWYGNYLNEIEPLFN